MTDTDRDTDTTDTTDTDEIMAIIQSIAEESMKQEQDRSSMLHTKADRLTTYVSIIMGLVNSALVFLLEQKIIDVHGVIRTAFWINFPFLISLLFAIQAQRTLGRLNYPSGIQILRDIEEASRVQTVQDLQFYKLTCMGKYTETLSNVNNKRAQYTAWSNLSYLLGFVAILLNGYFLSPEVTEILWCQIAVAVMGIFFYYVDE